MADLAVYNPEDVTILVAGLLSVDGFVDGTFVNIRKDVQPFNSNVTSDGITSRIYNKSQTYTVDITLYSGSSSNDFLTKLWQLDELTQRAKFPLLIKDSSGTDLFFSTTTWIEGIPALSKGTGYDARTWTLRSSQAIINVGGNTQSGILNDLLNIATGSLPFLEGII